MSSIRSAQDPVPDWPRGGVRARARTSGAGCEAGFARQGMAPEEFVDPLPAYSVAAGSLCFRHSALDDGQDDDRVLRHAGTVNDVPPQQSTITCQRCSATGVNDVLKSHRPKPSQSTNTAPWILCPAPCSTVPRCGSARTGARCMSVDVEGIMVHCASHDYAPAPLQGRERSPRLQISSSRSGQTSG